MLRLLDLARRRLGGRLGPVGAQVVPPEAVELVPGLCGRAGLSAVGSPVEGDEEEKEGEAGEEVDEDEASGELALGPVEVEQRLGAVEDEEHKLADLERGQVPLPPEVALDAGPESGEAVVGVHDDVDEHVGGGQLAVEGKRIELEADVHEAGHDAMVEDVQEADLRVLLAQDEEEGVEELEVPGVEEEVAVTEHQVLLLDAQGRLAAPELEPAAEGGHAGDEQVGVDCDQQQVVEPYRELQVVRLPVAHECGPGLEHDPQVGQGGGPGEPGALEPEVCWRAGAAFG